MLQTDAVILHEGGQECPGIPKQAVKNKISKTKGAITLILGMQLSYLLELQIDNVVLDWHGLGWPKEGVESYISKTVPKLIFEPLNLGEKRSYEIATASRSVCQYINR